MTGKDIFCFDIDAIIYKMLINVPRLVVANIFSKRWQTFVFVYYSPKNSRFATTLGLFVMSVNTAESEAAQPVAHKQPAN